MQNPFIIQKTFSKLDIEKSIANITLNDKI